VAQTNDDAAYADDTFFTGIVIARHIAVMLFAIRGGHQHTALWLLLVGLPPSRACGNPEMSIINNLQQVQNKANRSPLKTPLRLDLPQRQRIYFSRA
jgi:hypothetical protein